MMAAQQITPTTSRTTAARITGNGFRKMDLSVAGGRLSLSAGDSAFAGTARLGVVGRTSNRFVGDSSKLLSKAAFIRSAEVRRFSDGTAAPQFRQKLTSGNSSAWHREQLGL